MIYQDKFILFLIIIIKCVSVFCIHRNDNSITISVNTSNGVINGKTLTSLEGKGITVFKGIPYAEPPVRELRFKRPVPVKHWDKPIDAFDFGNSCVQSKRLIARVISGFLSGSEDCLNLNIWSPIIPQNISELKAVMFYIHPGALQDGGAMLTNGEALAALRDVVVVSINYRLGTLGFLYTGTEDAQGNMALWDQVLALQWVNDNIRHFGGDPQRITLFGHSAGSISVSLHVLSPISRHLFQNAIMSSGSVVDAQAGGNSDDHVQRWVKGAEMIGCNDESGTSNKFTTHIIDCLKNLDPGVLQQISYLIEMKSKTKTFLPLIVVDRELLMELPSKIFMDGDFKTDINLLIGTTIDEGSSILVMKDVYNYNTLFPTKFSYNRGIEELKQILTHLPTITPINVDEVAKHYFSSVQDRKNYDLIRGTIGTAFGDYYILCPTIEFAKQVFKFSNFSANVYQYLYNSECHLPFCAKWMNASHLSDVTPMFGTPFLEDNYYTDKDRQISSQLMDIITTFAKTGVPPRQKDEQWLKYYTGEDKQTIIAPYYEITTDPQPHTNFGLNFKHNNCEKLWKKYLY